VVAADPTLDDRRRSRRTRLRLSGRCLLADGGEHPCETIDISVSGVAIRSYIVAELGERVVVYLDELGRLEGVVTRRGDGWFAIETTISRNRIDRIAQKLAQLSGEDRDFIGAIGAAPQSQTVELKTEFGQSFVVQLAESNRVGARVLADFRLLPGVRVTVDHRPAVVAREATDGFVVEFNGYGR
jgi:PilZ domain